MALMSRLGLLLATAAPLAIALASSYETLLDEQPRDDSVQLVDSAMEVDLALGEETRRQEMLASKRSIHGRVGLHTQLAHALERAKQAEQANEKAQGLLRLATGAEHATRDGCDRRVGIAQRRTRNATLQLWSCLRTSKAQLGELFAVRKAADQLAKDYDRLANDTAPLNHTYTAEVSKSRELTLALQMADKELARLRNNAEIAVGDRLAERSERLAAQQALNRTLADLVDTRSRLTQAQGLVMKHSSAENRAARELKEALQHMVTAQQEAQAATKQRDDTMVFAKQQEHDLEKLSEAEAARARLDGAKLGDAEAKAALLSSMQAALNSTHHDFDMERQRNSAREAAMQSELATAQTKLAEQEAELKALRMESASMKVLLATQSHDLKVANQKVEKTSEEEAREARELSSAQTSLRSDQARTAEDETQLQAIRATLGAAAEQEKELIAMRKASEAQQRDNAAKQNKLAKDDAMLTTAEEQIKTLQAKAAEVPTVAARADAALHQKAQAEEQIVKDDAALAAAREQVQVLTAKDEEMRAAAAKIDAAQQREARAQDFALNQTRSLLADATVRVNAEAEELKAVHEELGLEQGRAKELDSVKEELVAARSRAASDKAELKHAYQEAADVSDRFEKVSFRLAEEMTATHHALQTPTAPHPAAVSEKALKAAIHDALQPPTAATLAAVSGEPAEPNVAIHSPPQQPRAAVQTAARHHLVSKKPSEPKGVKDIDAAVNRGTLKNSRAFLQANMQEQVMRVSKAQQSDLDLDERDELREATDQTLELYALRSLRRELARMRAESAGGD